MAAQKPRAQRAIPPWQLERLNRMQAACAMLYEAGDFERARRIYLIVDLYHTRILENAGIYQRDYQFINAKPKPETK